MVFLGWRCLNMSKKLTALLSSAVLLTASMNGLMPVNAYFGDYAFNSEGIAYSTVVDSTTGMYMDDHYLEALEPVRGTIQYGDSVKNIIENEDATCKMALKFRIYVETYNYPDEIEEFRNSHTIDGQTYAEAYEELSVISSRNLTAEQREKRLKIENETDAYIANFIAEDIANEIERLAENGITITNFDNQYDNPALYGNYYAILTAEELKNFPANPHLGYDVMLTAMPGDVHTDGNVDLLDVISVNKAVMGKEALTASQNAAADFDRNNTVNSADSLNMLKYIVGLK